MVANAAVDRRHGEEREVVVVVLGGLALALLPLPLPLALSLGNGPLARSGLGVLGALRALGVLPSAPVSVGQQPPELAKALERLVDRPRAVQALEQLRSRVLAPHGPARVVETR